MHIDVLVQHHMVLADKLKLKLQNSPLVTDRITGAAYKRGHDVSNVTGGDVQHDTTLAD